MAQGLGNPYAIKGRLVRVGVEKVAHLFRVQLDEANASLAKFDSSIWIRHFLAVCHLFSRQLPRNLYLPSADGQSNDVTCMLLGQMARGAADAASDVEYGSGGRESGALQQEVYQTDLGDLFGVGG